MEWNRREFLKIAGATTAVTAFGGLGFDLRPAYAEGQAAKLKFTKQSTSVCCYCSVGCNVICSTDKLTGKIFNIEGDPDMPINEGSLCAKGAGLFGLTEANEVLYRAPKSDKWEEKDWEWTLKRIARLVKDTRDKDFITHNAKGELVNRVESIGHYGSSNIGNEECWTLSVACRAMGLVHIDHQARV